MRPNPLLVGEVVGAVVLVEELELLLLLWLEGTLAVLLGVALTMFVVLIGVELTMLVVLLVVALAMFDWELEEDTVLVALGPGALDEVMLDTPVLAEELLDVVDDDEVVEAPT